MRTGRRGRRHHPRDRRRDGAGVRLHERLPRHGQRRRHDDLDARAAAARGRDARGDPQLRRRVPLARGRRDDREGTSSTRTPITTTIVFAGLVGAIVWNLATWYFGLPSSCSHALDRRRRRRDARGARHRRDPLRRARRQGARPGADRADPRVRRRGDRDPRLLPRSSVGSRPGPVNRGYRLGQVRHRRHARARARHERRAEDDGHHHARADRQRQPRRRRFDVPTWVIVSAATAIALGTYLGGWRIIKTMGSRIIKMDPAQGFAAQGCGRGSDPRRVALRLPALDHARDLRRGDGRRRREAAVRRALGRRRQHRRRVGADAARGRARRRRSSTASRTLFGDGAAGPVVVAAAGRRLTVYVFVRRLQQGAAITTTAEGTSA